MYTYRSSQFLHSAFGSLSTVMSYKPNYTFYTPSQFSFISSNTYLMFYIFVLLLPCLFLFNCIPHSHAQPYFSYQQKLAQAKLYIQKKHYKQAQIELEALRNTKEGERDVDVYDLLATNAYRMDKITQALTYLRQARMLTSDAQQRIELTERYKRWSRAYGLVQFVSKNDVAEGSIELKRSRPLINAKKKATFLRTQKELKRGVRTPISTYLPYGNYTANQIDFKLKRNQEAPTVKLWLHPLSAPLPTHTDKKSKSGLSKWVYVGIGSAILVAAIGTYYLMNSSESPPQTFKVEAPLK